MILCAIMLFCFLFLVEAVFVKTWIEGIEILAVELVGQQTQVFTEALIVHDLSGSEEADRVDDVWIVAEAQDVVIGGSRFLLSKGYQCTT